MKKTNITFVLFFLTATTILFLGYYRNQWLVVLPGKFRNFQFDDQSLVMGRLVETRKNGVFSHGALLGRGDIELFGTSEDDADYEAWYAHQYDSYLKGMVFTTFHTYGSQSGAQGMFFGALDRISPFTASNNLRIFRIITSLSLATVIGYLLLWFLKEFGWTSAIIALLTTAASPWLTLFGRNLFYFPTFFYIPIAAVTYYLGKHSTDIEQVKPGFVSLIFVSVLLKCLFNGFDFILPSILMIGVPLVYYAIRDKWRIEKFLRIGLLIAVGAAAAILVSVLILPFQSWADGESLSAAFKYVFDTFNRRTLGNPQAYPDYAESLEVSAWTVVRMYLEGNLTIARLDLRFMDLIFMFAGFTGIHLLKQKITPASPESALTARALIISTWASILSPLLWFIIFKGQSHAHPHTNFLSWYMPFIIYGFAMCGYIIENLFVRFKQAGTG